MKSVESKMLLTEALAAKALEAHAKVVDEFLKPDGMLPNVVGLGVGVKWVDGVPTGEPALLALVSEKIDKSQLGAGQMIPKKLGSMQTDVLAIGYPIAGVGEPDEVSAETLKRRVRPARGGYSVGHYKITAGTISTAVYRQLSAGVGIPAKYYILSNNHVLANCNSGSLGDPILQPGPYDGGTNPADKIAKLAGYVPIVFSTGASNKVDVAIAEAEFDDIDRSVYWIGEARGWKPKATISVGSTVMKTGRTTNFTRGRVTAVSATVMVGYGSFGTARFVDQFVTTAMSAGGDSGSLVLSAEPQPLAVGLLFAGSATATICNYIENVRSALSVEIAL